MVSIAKFAKLKGAKRVITVNNAPERLLFAAAQSDAEPLNFSEHTDAVKRLQQICPGGLDVKLDCGTFHEPKTWLHPGTVMRVGT